MNPMLAGKFDPVKVEKKLPLYGQIKFDGIRVFIRDGIAWTRSLKPVRSEQIQSWVAHSKTMLEGLDGEIICGEPTSPDCYTRTSSSVMSYNKPDDFTFYAFDKWDNCGTFEERLDEVEDVCNVWTKYSDTQTLRLAETILLETMDDVHEMHTNAIMEGHEGIILRSPSAFYKYGRGTPVQCELIKMKEGGWVDTECKVLGFYEQMENTNEQTRDNLGNAQRSGHQEGLVGKDTLGAFLLYGKFEDGREFECRCGSGLNDALRQKIWNDPASYRHQIVKIKYFNVGIKDKPRFPIFLGFRHPDDMSSAQQMDLFK